MGNHVATPPAAGLTRRQLLQRSAVVGGSILVTQSLGTVAAHAQTSAPPPPPPDPPVHRPVDPPADPVAAQQPTGTLPVTGAPIPWLTAAGVTGIAAGTALVNLRPSSGRRQPDAHGQADTSDAAVVTAHDTTDGLDDERA